MLSEILFFTLITKMIESIEMQADVDYIQDFEIFSNCTSFNCDSRLFQIFEKSKQALVIQNNFLKKLQHSLD